MDRVDITTAETLQPSPYYVLQVRSKLPPEPKLIPCKHWRLPYQMVWVYTSPFLCLSFLVALDDSVR